MTAVFVYERCLYYDCCHFYNRCLFYNPPSFVWPLSFFMSTAFFVDAVFFITAIFFAWLLFFINPCLFYDCCICMTAVFFDNRYLFYDRCVFYGRWLVQKNWGDAWTPRGSLRVRSLREFSARAPLEINLPRITPLGVNAAWSIPGDGAQTHLSRWPSLASLRRIVSRGTRAETSRSFLLPDELHKIWNKIQECPERNY